MLHKSLSATLTNLSQANLLSNLPLFYPTTITFLGVPTSSSVSGDRNFHEALSFTVTLAQVNDCDGGRAYQHWWTPLGVLRCLDLTAALEKGHFIPQRMQKL